MIRVVIYSITAVLLGTRSHDLFEDMLEDLLKYLTPDEIQEVLYQAVAYSWNW